MCCADYFGKDASEIRGKKLFLFDMDGTIYEEGRLFDGVLDLLQLIMVNGGYYVFITNNSSKSVNEYVEKVNRLGIRANRNNFFTSAQATIVYLNKNFPNAKVYCQGTKSLIRELFEAGIDVTEKVENEIDVVLVGFDTELTSQKIRNTCKILQEDVAYIATNQDLVCPVSFGFVPDCGSICGMIKNATGKEPVYIGKPNRIMIDCVREKLGYDCEHTVIIGDRLYTDIASGLNAGITAIAVLTGETSPIEINSSKYIPTYTFESVKEIYNIMGENSEK